MKSRRWLALLVSGVLLGLVLLVITFAIRVPVSSDRMRGAVVALLGERLDSKVELGGLTVRLFPRPRVEGTDLVVRHRGRRDVPPLVSVKRFQVEGSLTGLWRRRVSRVVLDGLEIHVPPDRSTGAGGKDVDSGQGLDGGGVTIDEVIAADAVLALLPRDPSRAPKTWRIHTLRLASVGMAQAMPFTAELTNAVPPGQIDATGSFGPWDRTEPARTPLGGTFSFQRADLGVFNGISGVLASKGAFGGALGRIEVQGEADVPDFALSSARTPVPLKANYHAVVDGTDGNTYLERVDAVLQETPIAAAGKIEREDDVKGRRVELDVTVAGGRLEDVLRLAVGTTTRAPMTGTLELQTKLVLPPGVEEVIKRLRLDGSFSIAGGRFNDPNVQRQVNGLSARASGRAVEGAASQVASDFSGTFALGDGVLRLPQVTFDVPGALVELGGEHSLVSESLDFKGTLFMDARLSETVSGMGSVLLKVVDPLFRKDGRTVVPLRITGTRGAPRFGLDRGRVFGKG